MHWLTCLDGTPVDEVKRLVNHWLNNYDWRIHEAKLNTLPQFILPVQIEGFDALNVHFVHQLSSHKDAIPLMFIHGWPGHFHEVVKILPLLTEPPEGQQAFHVIAPSIPGFAFSDNPNTKGYNLHKVADTFNKLMISLGYDEYVVQGGDWGSSIARMLGLLYPENCKGVHVNLFRAVNPPRWYKNPWIWIKMHSQLVHYSKEEEALMARSRWFVEKEVGYRVRYFAKSLMTRRFKLLSLRVWLMDCGILLLDCLLGSEKNYIPGLIIILGQMMRSLHGYPISIRPLILGHGNLPPENLTRFRYIGSLS
jgi:pimeloyl-ACP methyl ester carboxylesterase